MLREQTVAIVSQCQLQYENSTKKIVSSFPESCESTAQDGMQQGQFVQAMRRPACAMCLK
jgi:hypothetical protein